MSIRTKLIICLGAIIGCGSVMLPSIAPAMAANTGTVNVGASVSEYLTFASLNTGLSTFTFTGNNALTNGGGAKESNRQAVKIQTNAASYSVSAKASTVWNAAATSNMIVAGDGANRYIPASSSLSTATSGWCMIATAVATGATNNMSSCTALSTSDTAVVSQTSNSRNQESFTIGFNASAKPNQAAGSYTASVTLTASTSN